MKTYVASKNAGKLKELREIFAGTPFELDVYPGYPDVEETADNYAQNAMLKARALFAQLHREGIWAAVLADDSGIEVDALGGRPGVLSARYAPGATWPERLRLLLAEVGERADEERGAKFVCAMALILPEDREVEGYGEVSGSIARSTSGASGFGYDPVFYYP
ncbi:MAG: non-canonical purine NTP pyrophosphatase, partial [Candidatus Eremiobacteraeota bacterium]|nr:non-canonical purine NTP pyrophosphatase [Candidatus Eremiobacteraeota bacterium]